MLIVKLKFIRQCSVLRENITITQHNTSETNKRCFPSILRCISFQIWCNWSWWWLLHWAMRQILLRDPID